MIFSYPPNFFLITQLIECFNHMIKILSYIEEISFNLSKRLTGCTYRFLSDWG